MKPGQRVRAEIVLDERPDVLTVPRQAVFEKDGEKIVYVQNGGSWEATEVELGPSSLGRLVISSGLEPGDRIALRDPTRPADAPVEADSDGDSPPSAPSRGARTIRIVG
jgi:multidrug efflux pump subunit AcrA (membrane-fusion protein)